MSVNSFIPEIWAAALLSSLKKNLVYGSSRVVNSDYEGDINEAGDTVTINSIGRPTIGTYTKGVTTISPEQLTTAARKLVIDQSKYFAFEVDDIDRRQSRSGDRLLDEGIAEASYGLRDVVDTYIAGLYTGVQSANALGTVAVTTADLAYTQLKNLKVKLDEANVPQEGRYAIVPPWFHGLLLENNKFVDASASGSTEPLLNGYVGRAVGFDILVSNNCPNPTGDDWVVQAGVRGAITFAQQINKVEAYRPEDAFSDAVKGLQLYGAKLIRPDSIATVVASIT